MSNAHQIYESKKRRITINGIFYAVISSMSFGFSPLFSLALIGAGLSDFDILSYRWLIAGLAKSKEKPPISSEISGFYGCGDRT